MNIGATMTAEHNQIENEKGKKYQRKLDLLKGLLFLSPSIILFSIFVFYPMIRTVYLSFFLTNQAGATTQFVGCSFLTSKEKLKSSNFDARYVCKYGTSSEI